MTCRKTLGIYLVVLALMQTALYIILAFSNKLEWLFYFDPRIGITAFEEAIYLWGVEPNIPGIFGWISAGWLIIISIFFISGRPLIKTYIISELILAAPSLVFFSVIAFVNIRPSCGFSVGELIFPIPVFLVFSVLPLIIAFRCLREKKKLGNFG